MVRKIETQEIITKRAARVKYRTQYFVMIVTKVVDHADNDLGYVIYAADNNDDLLEVSSDEYKGMKVAFMVGAAAEPFPQIGNVVYHV